MVRSGSSRSWLGKTGPPAAVQVQFDLTGQSPGGRRTDNQDQPFAYRLLGRLSTRDIEVRSYFRDVLNHLTIVNDPVARFDELLTTLANATLAKVSLQQNNDMRKIIAWAAIIAVPTMGVGIYGMNFDYMPELHWDFGYPVVMGVVLLICAVVYRTFRRNDWLYPAQAPCARRARAGASWRSRWCSPGELRQDSKTRQRP